MSSPIITTTMEIQAEITLSFAAAALVSASVENNEAMASRYPTARLTHRRMCPPCSMARGRVVMFRRQVVIRQSERITWLLVPEDLWL